VEQQKIVITTYPGDPNFEPEKFQEIAESMFAKTLNQIRDKIGLPKLSLVDISKKLPTSHLN
jgi:hypothetical protein